MSDNAFLPGSLISLYNNSNLRANISNVELCISRESENTFRYVGISQVGIFKWTFAKGDKVIWK
jgi:hypothetical protein